ncbi:hypothetical protein D1007_61595 [Hordeum vulgare]|nr:hypothetical protein D1007_61595 [Hordeum vulgare]
MGIFSAAGSRSGKNKGKAPVVPWHALPLPSSSRLPRQQISVRVHQARWQWEHRVPLPYPDVILSHDPQLDPERIPMSTVPQSAWAHAEEEAEAAYKESLAAALRESKEEERRKEEEEEEAYQARMAKAIAISATDDYVVPLLAPPYPTKLEPASTALKTQEYV